MQVRVDDPILSNTISVKPSPVSVWMEQITPCFKDLAWCHNTDAWSLQQIIRRGVLYPEEPCDVFGEPICYFFCGRPAFKSKDCMAPIRTTACAPVVIMMSSDIIKERKRVFPFDSGAFVRGRYSPWIHKSMELQDFEITRLADSPRRHVSAFYDSNHDYMVLRPRPPRVPYGDYYQVEALVAMLNDKDVSSADDRRFAVELQVARPLPFQWPLVRALILPRDLETAPHVKSFLAGPGRGVEVRWFDRCANKLAIEYQALLEERARDLHAAWRLL